MMTAHNVWMLGWASVHVPPRQGIGPRLATRGGVSVGGVARAQETKGEKHERAVLVVCGATGHLACILYLCMSDDGLFTAAYMCRILSPCLDA
jgi:hypothetical protein